MRPLIGIGDSFWVKSEANNSNGSVDCKDNNASCKRTGSCGFFELSLELDDDEGQQYSFLTWGSYGDHMGVK